MDDLTRLETWCKPLLDKLSAGERTRLARAIATPLRRSQTQRIAAQRNPDGSGYEARKPRIRDKKGRMRKGMFARLRTATYLRAKATPNSAAVEFVGRVSRIARVHQEGGEDRVSRSGPRVRYPKRGLLGFSAEDERLVRGLLIEYLGR